MDSLGRPGHGSSIDGVPFKIGPKFTLPPKIIYQPVITNFHQSQGDEYTFETEEAVLAWAKAREEALIKASLEQANKASNAVKDAECDREESESEEEEDESIAECESSGINSAVIKPNATTGGPFNPPKPVPPKPIQGSNTILQPTPIQPVNKNIQQNGNNPVNTSAVDVSMFERVEDPFDVLELQTLDDMEELNKVLLNSATPKDKEDAKDNKEKPNTNPFASDVKDNSSEGFYELAAPISTSCWEQLDSEDPVKKTPEESCQENINVISLESARHSESPISDVGDYVDIVKEGVNFQGSNDVKYVPSKHDVIDSQTNVISGLLPKGDAGNRIYKPVLPPIPGNHPKLHNGLVEPLPRATEHNSNSIFPSSTSASVNTNPISQQTGESDVTMNSTVMNHPKPVRLPPPPPSTKPKRPVAPCPKPRNSGQLWSSTGPSLANCLDSTTKCDEEVPKPFSFQNMTTSSPDLSQEFQDKISTENPNSPLPQLNRYRPLPPTPSPRSTNLEKGTPQSIGLTDPYISLSSEDQEFTNRITSMGFLRAKVARAVQKFGRDEKEVLDHLFAVDTLVERKFAPVHAEAALHTCKNDLDKAEKLLKMQSQLEELGFTSENVRSALIKSDMDHDKALDILTA